MCGNATNGDEVNFLFVVFALLVLFGVMATPLVQGLPPFDPDLGIGASVGPRWRTWLADFETFVIANYITNDKKKRALLLYQAGSRVREIFCQLPDTEEDTDYQRAVGKLNDYFEPQKIGCMRFLNFARPNSAREKHSISFIPESEVFRKPVNLLQILLISN